MAIHQRLQQKLLQRLSPQQIQLMKLLQVPTASLETRIKEELEENPALELEPERFDEKDNAEDEFDTAEETGGSATATLPSHTHTFTGTALATHNHQIGSRDSTANDGGGSAQEFVNDFGTGSGAAATTSSVSGGTPAGTNSTEGASATNANYQPYITVYMWKRTA